MGRRMTQAELVAEARDRFGEDPLRWAFVCPTCKDVATAQDFKDADADPQRVGQECIGRSLGCLNGAQKGWTGRGCDWTAYGLFPGPWLITLPDGREVRGFALAEGPAS